MGKTPKKAAPGGDERNLYNRRPLKATAAASKASETNLHKRQRESESSNRSMVSTIQKNIPQAQKKNFKNKAGIPRKFEVIHSKRQSGRPPSAHTKEKRLALLEKPVESKSANMQPESEEAEVKVDVSKQNETENDVSNNKQEPIKEPVDHASSEATSNVQNNSTNTETVVEQEQAKEQETRNDSVQSKEADEHEENDLSLSLQMDDSPRKSDEPKENNENSKEDGKEETITESKINVSEKEDVHSESQTDTESYSVDILESTTSELSEASETPSQTDVHKEKTKFDDAGAPVSYDPAIMLKDVQIKLNDCMKEGSKGPETNSVETNNADTSSPNQALKDLSFGKTLRNISGRRSLSRMRHVTLREQRYSPNNSMFVNTSGASMLPDETEDFKILRYGTGLTDAVSTSNDSPTERKRKHDAAEWNSSMKKQKTESENSLLNTSISLLKGLRRPIQVSTSVSELKFQTGKLDLSDDENNKPVNKSTKEWCAMM